MFLKQALCSFHSKRVSITRCWQGQPLCRSLQLSCAKRVVGVVWKEEGHWEFHWTESGFIQEGKQRICLEETLEHAFCKFLLSATLMVSCFVFPSYFFLPYYLLSVHCLKVFQMHLGETNACLAVFILLNIKIHLWSTFTFILLSKRPTSLA